MGLSGAQHFHVSKAWTFFFVSALLWFRLVQAIPPWNWRNASAWPSFRWRMDMDGPTWSECNSGLAKHGCFTREMGDPNVPNIGHVKTSGISPTGRPYQQPMSFGLVIPIFPPLEVEGTIPAVHFRLVSLEFAFHGLVQQSRKLWVSYHTLPSNRGALQMFLVHCHFN